jgi:hypothetical protein
MFIYLDTSQLFEITKWRDIDKEFIDVFFRQWNEKSAVLCLSLQHLHEIAQLEDKHSREKRFHILQKFNKFRFTPLGWCSIIQREAIVQMLNHLSKINNDSIQLFKKNIWKQTNAEFLLNYVEQNLELLLKCREIYEAASDIDEIFKPIKKILGNYPKGRFKSLDAKPDDLEEAKGIIEQLKSIDETSGLSGRFIEKIYKAREETGSLSSAIIKLLELEGVPEIEKRYLSDAGSLAAFYKLAREAIPYVAKLAGVSQSEVAKYVAKINLSSCPGFSLQMALLRAFRSSDKKIVPSDWLDANHIVYAPYVDIFFADKRTCDFLHKETRNQAFRIEQSLISNIRRIVPLNKFIEEISSV